MGCASLPVEPPLLTALASGSTGNVKKSCLVAQSTAFAARRLGSEALKDALREDGRMRAQATEVTKRADVALEKAAPVGEQNAN